MKHSGWSTTFTGVAALAAVVAGPAGRASADTPTEGADPAVVAMREQAANALLPPGYQAPPDAQPALAGSEGRMKDLYWLSAKSTSGGYIELSARDNPAQDKPGKLTTTLRVYGNAAAFRDGNGLVGLVSQFTCTGIGISGVTIGTSGASITGGSSSKTLTVNTNRQSSSVVRQYYTEGGHFRCQASNLGPAKFTRHGFATASYKTTDTRAQDDYSFVW